MLIKIPDEYKAFLDNLDRNGIPYEVVESKYREVLETRAETLSYIKVIDLNKIDKNNLIDKAIDYIDQRMEMNKYVLDHLYNEAIRHAYADLTGQEYKEGHVEK